MSLADELMADLEGSDEEEELEVKKEEEEMESEDIKPSKLELEQVCLLSISLPLCIWLSLGSEEADVVGHRGVAQLWQTVQDYEEDRQMAGWSQPADINWEGVIFIECLCQGRVRKKVEQLGPIENDPEYQLIVEVTKTASTIFKPKRWPLSVTP